MESPDTGGFERTPLMVSQAVAADRQLLPSLPFVPFTYHVVTAEAAGDEATNKAMPINAVNTSLSLMISPFITLPGKLPELSEQRVLFPSNNLTVEQEEVSGALNLKLSPTARPCPNLR